MFENLLDGFIATNKGIDVNESFVLEHTALETFEDKQYLSEVDELRINETAEIMADVFSNEVIESWSEMTLDEKGAKLNEYYIKAGMNLNIETKGVIIEPIPSDSPGLISMGYNSGDGYIHLNEAMVNDPSKLEQILDTATHEMRHQFQSDVLDSPEKFRDIPQNILGIWEYELDPRHYIDPDYDFQGYFEQAVECDARSFSEEVIKSYMEIVRS